MHDLRRRFGIGIATAGLLILGLGLTPGTSFAKSATSDVTECPAAFNGAGDNPGHLTLTKDPVGSTVVAGSAIAATAHWVTADWTSLDKLLYCVRIAGADQEDLSDEIKPVPAASATGGSYGFTVPVAAGTPVGTEICIAVRLSGAGQTQKTGDNGICYTVAAPDSTGGGSITGGGNITAGGNITGGDTSGDRSNDGDGSPIGGGTTTQVEGATLTQTPTGSEVLGAVFEAPAGSQTTAAATNQTETSASGAAGPSGSALPATSGATSPEALASTGSATQALVLLAGLALLLGGLSLSFSAPRRGLA